MDFNDIFVSRDKSFVSLNEAADYLGRRLRENLVIFSIDDSKSEISFVSEKNHLIECNYDYENDKVVLENFKVTEIEDIYSDERIDEQASNGVSEFVRSLHESKYDGAEDAFQSLMDTFTVRGRIDETRRKLEKKLSRFGETYNIVETKTWGKFQEALPIFEKFVADNSEALFENDKIMEGLRLLAWVSQAYEMPRLQLEALSDEMIVVEPNNNKTLYEMICNKELIRKELLESKESFASMWASNGSIANLASTIYAKPEKIHEALIAAVKEIPYLALANKSELVRVMESTFEVNDPGTITQKEIKDFVNDLFEMKKPMKDAVTSTLNEKYGVNVQSLKFVPSFKGLSQIHGEVFDMLSEECESGILGDVLSEMSNLMERKGGVQVLDVADVIIESFRKAGVNLATQEFVSLEEVLEEGERYEDVVASQGKDYAERMRLKKEREEKEKKKTVKEEDESSEEEEVVQEKKLSPEQSKEMDTDKDGDIDGEDLENLRDKKKKGAAKKDEDDEKEDKSEKGDDAAMTAESKEEEGEEELDLGAEVRSGKDITQELADILDSLDLDSLTSDSDE
jgi:hypothetical protein